MDYGDGQSLCFVEYANLINEALGGLDINIQLEPGRSLVAAAGVLVTTVVATKQAEPRNFVMLDAGMNDLIWPGAVSGDSSSITCHVVESAAGSAIGCGWPICESTDCFLKDYVLPLPQEGDLMVFTMTGAYSAVLSSTYNSRPLVAEVLLENTNTRVIRKAWTLEEQLQLEA